MAHVAKYNAKALGNLVAHYERSRPSTLDRGNIDKDRTALNYDLRPTDMLQEVQAALLQHEQTAGRRARSDAVVMFDWVVTLPGNVPEGRSREFFESVTRFIEGRYGPGNVLGAHVHMDEATPHVHVSVLPMLSGKLQASKMVNRSDLNTFHESLRAAVSADMGFEVEILLDESKRALKELSRLPQDDYRAARAEITRTTERLESVRRSWEETRGNPIADFREAREERALDREIAELEARVEREERGVAQLERDACEVRRRIVGAGDALERVRARFRELVEGLQGIAETIGRYFAVDELENMTLRELDDQIQQLRDEIAAQVAGSLDPSDKAAAIERSEQRQRSRQRPPGPSHVDMNARHDADVKMMNDVRNRQMRKKMSATRRKG